MKSKSLLLLRVTLCGLTFLLAGPSARAATKTWDGSSSGLWSVSANWAGNVIPANGDDLVFPTLATQLTTTNDLSNLRLKSIISSNDYVLQGNPITLTNGITAAIGDTTIDFAITNAANQTFKSVTGPARLKLNGNIVLGANTLTNSGGGNIIYFGTISGTGGLVVNGYRTGLHASNSFSGPVTVAALAGTDIVARLNVGDSFALGGTTGGTVVKNGFLELEEVQVGLEPLTLEADSEIWSRGGVLSTNSWAGPITLAQDSLIHVNSRLILTGPISGPGGLTKLGERTLLLAGSSANTFSGTTTVEQGTLELNDTAVGAVNMVPGDLVIESGPGIAVVRLGEGNQISNSSAVTVNEGGVLDLNGFSETIGALTINGADITTGPGTLTLEGNLTASAVGNPANGATISGNLSLGSATRTISVSKNQFIAADLIISANISGNAGVGIIKTGAGTVRLSGNNIYSGLTTVSDGVVLAASATAFGSSAAGTVLSGGNITVEGLTIANESLTNNSAGSALESLTDVPSGWSSSIVLNADLAVGVYDNGTLNLSGVISGTGGVTKSGSSTLIYSGNSGNTYSGNTIVNEGVLELDKTAGLSAINSRQLIIGDGTGGINADIVRYAANDQVLLAVDIIVNDTGLMDLNNFNDLVGDISLIGGAIDTGTGILTMGANLAATSTALTDADIVGNLTLNSSTRTFTVTNGNQAQDLQISAAVSGSGGITKEGAGRMSLLSSNSYSGLTTVNDGILRIFDDYALGTTAGGTVLNGDSILELSGPINVGAESLTNNSPGQPGVSVNNLAGSNSWAGGITLQINTIIGVVANTTLNLAGMISGAGGLTKVETGTLYYSGNSANNYAGVTTVNAGTLVLGKSLINGALTNALIIGDKLGGANADVVRTEGIAQLPDTVAVTVNSSGRWEVNVAENSFGSLAGSGNVVVNTAPPNGIGPGFNHSSTVFSGIISGTGAFTKNGTGTMTLGSNNTYTGTTTVNGGTLLVNGSQPQSHVSVGASGTLGGSGTVGNITNTVGGVVAPGSSPGILTSSNATFSAASSDFTVELNGTTPGSGHDQLKVLGAVSLGSAALKATLGFQSAISSSFTIIDNDGTDAVTGTINGLPQGSTLHISGVPFQISYTGGSGNDVVLTQLADLPALNIQRDSNTNVVLLWPTNYIGFTLECNTNLNTDVWTAASPPPSVSGTNNVVTNETSVAENFYRLRAP